MSEAAAAVDELVQDPSEEVRLAVLDVMMLSPDPLLRTAALRRDPSVTVRAHAAAALDRTNPTLAKQAVKILEGMLDDAAPEVRAAALASLAGSADSEGLRAFGRAWPKTTLETRLKLRVEPRGRVISGRLTIRLTTSADPSERRAAVAALGALKVTGFHVHIVPALRDPSPDVRIAAVQALASVNDESVRARLSEMVSDPDGAVRDAARRSTLRTVG